jgi:nucleoside-diphosphate-sugar epimerase
VYKTANEGSARVYWEECRIPSVGLRPLTVYGVGRELGITSGPTKAIKAALLERDYTIGFSGVTGFHYAEDVAAAFVACARARPEGALALNLRGELMDVSDFVRVVESVVPGASGRIGIEGPVLPIACDFLQTGLDELVGPLPRTSAAEGVRRTAERFRELLARDCLPLEDLEA